MKISSSLFSLFFLLNINQQVKAQSQFDDPEALADKSVHLTADTFSVNFTVYNYFPFIRAEVNGVKGWLLFDTGAESAIELDDKVLKLGEGKSIGSGFVGSGQSFEVNSYDEIDRIEIDKKLVFENCGSVTGHNFSYMNTITDSIIGLIGYDFFKGYLFKLDYESGQIIFYRNTDQRRDKKDYLLGEKIIGIIDFTTRKLPNHPIIPVTMNGDTIAVSFDTGQLGTLFLTGELKEKWIKKRKLKVKNDVEVELKSFSFPGNVFVKPRQMHLFPDYYAKDQNESIGITEANSITFGYGLLSQYKTVWDFENRKIYLLIR